MSNHAVALVTGSARRIGRALIECLHKSGYRVIIHYHHSEQAAQDLYDHCNQQRSDSTALLSANLNQLDQCHHLIKQAANIWGRLDVLVNNASRFSPTPIGQTTLEQAEALIHSNFSAPFFLAQAAFPYLQKNNGCIINFSDSVAEQASGDYSIYRAAKTALNSLTRSLAFAMAPNVRVNAVAPGKTLWPEGENAPSDQEKEHLLQQIPLQRQASLTEITDTLLFLVNNHYITGQVIAVDGGLSQLHH